MSPCARVRTRISCSSSNSDFPETPELEIEADISVVHLFEEHPVVIAGADHHFIRVLGRDFRVSAASFFQVNTPMAEKMVDHLLAALPVSKSDTLLDLYCGVGLFSAFFASRAGRVIGVESSESACEDFAINLDEFENVELYEGAAEEILPALVGRIANPPYMHRRPSPRGTGSARPGRGAGSRSARDRLRLVRPVHVGAGREASHR